jgi:hypothetical protein
VGAGTSRHASGSQPSQALGWHPSTEEERAAVRNQLERILASPGFRNSKKYPAFLRYIVEHTLNGQADHLKERTLGIEVFGRPLEYDTGVDPVVRIVAAEVRKRIGQYYHESATPGELLLDLPSGSYVPKFTLPDQSPGPPPAAEPVGLEPAAAQEALTQTPVVSPLVPTRPSWRSNLRSWHVVAALSLAVLLGGLAWLTWWRTDAMDQFWGPMLDSSPRVLIITGGGVSWIPQASPPAESAQDSSVPLSVAQQQSRDLVSYADATALAAVGGTLRSYQKSYLIRPSMMIDLPQLRTGSAVLIGALNNPWTLRLTANLRFRFMRDEATRTNWIQDRKNPDMRDWKVVTSLPYTLITEDWAVISRFKDPDTEHWIVTAPGLSRWGTLAAGEFLTNATYLRELARRAPRDWERKNLQAVIATTVINGQPGPPRILATEFW